MKRGIIAGVIILLVTATAIWTNFSLISRTEALENAAAIATESQEKLPILKYEWEKQKEFFEIFLDHTYFDHIEFDVLKLEQTHTEKYADACAEVKLHFAALRDHISFSIGDLL